MKHTTSFSFDDEFKKKIIPHLSGTQTISQFAFNACEEKVNRLEKKDEKARIELLKRDSIILAAAVKNVICEMKERGEI